MTRGDTVYVATADGILISADRGAGWTALTDGIPGGLPSRYVLTLAPARAGGLWVSTLRGLGEWRADAGYRATSPSPTPVLGQRIRAVFVVEAPGALVPVVLGGETCAGGMRPRRRSAPASWQCMGALTRGAPQGGRAVRALSGCGGVLCAGATSSGAVFGARLGLTLQAPTGPARSRDVYAVLPPPPGEPGDTLFGTACGFLGAQPDACVSGGDSAGVRAPTMPRHTWLERPIGLADQPYIDQTSRFGARVEDGAGPARGVDFHNPPGTAVRAVGDGVVAYAGTTEDGDQSLVVRHDSALAVPGGGGSMLLFSVYGHTDRILVAPGERVRRGQEVARVGNTGRAIGSRLHLEIHAAPRDSAAAIVTGPGRPSFARNPELWIEPLPGTGLVAGTVVDGRGRPVRGARVYGLVKPEPQEAPFSYAETYGERALSDPGYQEHFAVGDVPPGEYVLGVQIEGRRVFRRVRVEAGKLTWVEFRP
ncbi:MAG: M23 family metallopeptidase [Gemmatimonadetes bacterium]|nr:M23 family metallopeptidase [Gemmatimonadota bacterium]